MLFKKMLRDLLENKGAYFACTVIITIGLIIFTAFSIVSDNLFLSRNTFYHNQNFAEGFAEVERMPREKIKELSSLPGIAQIEGRLIKDVLVLFPDRTDNVYLRIVSVDPESPNPINGVLLDKGIPLATGRMNIWVDNNFLEANDLELNQEIEIIAEGRKRSLQIVGSGKNPEFIYAMRTAGELYPDPQTFGIAYIPYEMTKTLFKENGMINNIVFTLKPGAEYQDVENTLKPKLDKYGLKSLYPRKDQSSHLILEEELSGIEAMSFSLPLLFLSVASFILYIMLKRMIESQRGQIGILKALGYTRTEILTHYMSYGVILGLLGGILGGLLGAWLSYPFTSLYEMYFNMPDLRGSFSPSYLLFAILLSLLFSTIASYQGSKAVLRLEPAEAMNPPAPPVGKKIVLESITAFWNMLTVQGKMATRNIFRHPGRNLFILLGIMFTFALLATPWVMKNMVDIMIFDQYEKIEVYDAKVSLAYPLDKNSVEKELARFPGVLKVETKAEAPVTLSYLWHKKNVVLLGLPSDGDLHRIIDKSGKQIRPPKNGILLSERLADLLAVTTGDELLLTSPFFKNTDTKKTVLVSGVVSQTLGINAYMDLEALHNLFGQGDFVTTAMIGMERQLIPTLQQEYRNAAAVSNIENQTELFRKMKELMASYDAMIYSMLIFGIITGFAIIYSSSIISLSERSRELASMMVLGMTPAEVLSVITFEQWFLSAPAMLAGIPLTKLMLKGMAQSVNNDIYTVPTSLDGVSIINAFLVTVASIWIAQRFAAKRIKKLRIVDVLKARE